MSEMKELQVMIEEVARIALESPTMRSYVGHELGLSEESLEKLHNYLDSLVDCSWGNGKELK